MQQQNPPPSNEALNAFAKAIGFLIAIVTTMPAYHASYDLFYHYALRYSYTEYLWFWELVWLGCLFLTIIALCWFAISTVVKWTVATIKILFVTLFALITSLRR